MDIKTFLLLAFIAWLVYQLQVLKTIVSLIRFLLNGRTIVATLIIVGALILGPASGGISVPAGIILAGWYLLGKGPPDVQHKK